MQTGASSPVWTKKQTTSNCEMHYHASVGGSKNMVRPFRNGRRPSSMVCRAIPTSTVASWASGYLFPISINRKRSSRHSNNRNHDLLLLLSIKRKSSSVGFLVASNIQRVSACIYLCSFQMNLRFLIHFEEERTTDDRHRRQCHCKRCPYWRQTDVSGWINNACSNR